MEELVCRNLPACAHLDGGYGWVVVFCSFMLQGISGGLSLSVGVFYVEWLDYFGQSHGLTAWVGSINTGLLFACGPVVSLSIQKFSHRYVAFSGGILAAIGLLTSSYCQHIWQLYVTYGLLTGVGLSSIYIPASVICSEYFQRLRPLAMGIACSGVGLFCLGIPIFAQMLINHYGWRGAVIFMSGLAVQSCLFSYLLFPIKFWQTQNYADKSQENSQCQNDSTKTHIKGEWFKSTIGFVLNLEFCLFFVNNILWNAASLMVLVFIVDYAYLHGISNEKGALLVSIIGLCGLIGRFGSGLFGNIFKIRRLLIFNLATVITVLAIGGLPLFDNFIAFAMLCMLYGIGFGGQIGVLAVTVIELVGADKLTTAFGYIMVSHGIGALCGPPLGGLLYEQTHSYQVPFYVAAALSLVAVVMACFIPVLNRQNTRHSGALVALQVD